MSAVPCFAAVSDLYPGVVYAAEPVGQIPGNGEHLTVWLSLPAMGEELAKAYRWLQNDAYIEGPHISLTDYGMAELLFVAGGDPLALDDTAALAAIDRALTEVCCNMLWCSKRVSDALAQHPADAAPRWHRCLERARLLAVA